MDRWGFGADPGATQAVTCYEGTGEYSETATLIEWVAGAAGPRGGQQRSDAIRDLRAAIGGPDECEFRYQAYEAIATPPSAQAEKPVEGARCLLAVWWTPAAGDEGELDAWYTGEHIPRLMRVDGWLRIRRFRRVAGPGPEYVALHDLADEDVIGSPAHLKAGQSPWRERLVASRREHERRVYRLLHKHGFS